MTNMDANSFNVNVLREKPRIVNVLKMRGPSVAPSIAKDLGLNSFLASALLSELLNDKQIKASNLRVGGGPLYYIPGQEAMVENFIQFLPGKEREAFQLLKKEEMLEDSKQEPAIRVALRAIKDFSVPLKVYLNNEERLFWKIHTMGKEEFEKRINILLNPQDAPKEIPKEAPKEEKKEKAEAPVQEKRKEEVAEKPKAKKERKPKASFESMVDSWLKGNNASVIELSKDEKNAQGKVSIPGKGEFILVARNKRSLNEIDLIIASQMGANEKLPVILLSNGKPSKKAGEILGFMKGIGIHKL